MHHRVQYARMWPRVGFLSLLSLLLLLLQEKRERERGISSCSSSVATVNTAEISDKHGNVHDVKDQPCPRFSRTSQQAFSLGTVTNESAPRGVAGEFCPPN